MTTTTRTERQVQDFRNGYSHGYHEARHGETSVDGSMASEDYAEGVRRGLADGASRVRASAEDSSQAGRAAMDMEAALRTWMAL